MAGKSMQKPLGFLSNFSRDGKNQAGKAPWMVSIHSCKVLFSLTPSSQSS